MDYQFVTAENAVYTNLTGIGRVTIYRQGDGGTIDTVGTGLATLDGESRALERIVTAIQYDENANLTDLYASVTISFFGERTEIPFTCADCLLLIVDNIEFTVSDNITSDWELTDSDHQFKVFPNPTRDLVRIEVPNTFRGQLRLMNQTGQLLRQLSVTTTTTTISVEGHSPGMIYVVDDKGKIVGNFIKH